jgi:hypothetical protein
MFLFAPPPLPLVEDFTTETVRQKIEDLVARYGPSHAELAGPDSMYLPTTQIKIVPGGLWHRRGPQDSHTACGETYTACGIREYRANVPDLCPHCFTEFERKLH